MGFGKQNTKNNRAYGKNSVWVDHSKPMQIKSASSGGNLSSPTAGFVASSEGAEDNNKQKAMLDCGARESTDETLISEMGSRFKGGLSRKSSTKSLPWCRTEGIELTCHPSDGKGSCTGALAECWNLITLTILILPTTCTK